MVQQWSRTLNLIYNRGSRISLFGPKGLGKPVADEELIAIFLKGLHPIFQPVQVHFAIPGTLPKKWDDVINIIRKFAATPVVAVELAKLKWFQPQYVSGGYYITTQAETTL